MDKRHSRKPGAARIIGGARSSHNRQKPNKIQTKITDFVKTDKAKAPPMHKKVDLNKVKFKQLNNNKRE